MYYYVGKRSYQCDVYIGDFTFRTSTPKSDLIEIGDDAANIALDHFDGNMDTHVDARTNILPLLIPLSVPDGKYILALEWLCDLNGFAHPDYEYEGSLSARGWKCRVSLNKDTENSYENTYGETFSTWENAQEDAARRLFESLVHPV